MTTVTKREAADDLDLYEALKRRGQEELNALQGQLSDATRGVEEQKAERERLRTEIAQERLVLEGLRADIQVVKDETAAERESLTAMRTRLNAQFDKREATAKKAEETATEAERKSAAREQTAQTAESNLSVLLQRSVSAKAEILQSLTEAVDRVLSKVLPQG